MLKKKIFSLFLLLFDFTLLQQKDLEALKAMFSRKINYVHKGQVFIAVSYFYLEKA